MNNRNSDARSIAFGGMLLAINLIILSLLRFIPTNTISLMALSSFIVAIVVIEFGIGKATIFWIASLILGFFAIGNMAHYILYAIVFSHFGIAKALIEKYLEPYAYQVVAKLLYATLIFFVLYIGFTWIIPIKNVDWFIVFPFVGLVYIYDFLYSKVIIFYIDKIQKHIRM